MIPKLLLISIIVIILLSNYGAKEETVRLKILFVLLFLFAALRGSGSGDYYNYLNYSSQITSLADVFNSEFPMEIGFRAISYLNNLLKLNPQFVIMSMNFISLSCVYIFIKKHSADKLLSVILFLPLYFQFDMHAARTAVAIGIGCLGYDYLTDRKLLKYSLTVFLANLFHRSALILFPLYFFLKKKINKYLLFSSVAVLMLASQLLSINGIILRILKFIPIKSLSIKYSAYMDSGKYGYSYKIYDPRLMLLVLIFVYAMYLLDRSNETENTLINIIWSNIILILMFSENTLFVTRLTSFLNLYTILIVPLMLNKYKERGLIKEYYIQKTITVIVYLAYVTRFVLGTVDYRFYFLN